MSRTVIRRVGGGPDDEWYFDGQSLAPCCPSRVLLQYDGAVLRESENLGKRCWALTGTALGLVDSEDPAWSVANGLLTRSGSGSPEWSYAPRSLVAINLPVPMQWRAEQDVALVVMAYVAGLLNGRT